MNGIKVRKREGTIVDFNMSKIEAAVLKAAEVIYPNNEYAKAISPVVAQKTYTKILEIDAELVDIEQIQDFVEDCLMELGENKIAREYIRYRLLQHQIRESKKVTASAYTAMEDYMNEDMWEGKENANMSFSLQGMNNQIVSKVTKGFWLDKTYPQRIKEAHQSGDLHVHDLSLLAPYCCGWSLEDLLKKGFGGVSGKIESAPPKHFRTALGQLVNFFYTLQGEAAGAQAVSSFDTYLAPFVRHDNLSYDEVKQAMQEFIFNLNVPTRVGFQTPFVNLTLDLKCPKPLKDLPVIIGGERIHDKRYGNYQKEMEMINLAFCEIMTAGDAKGRVFSFPIPTYNVTKEWDWEDNQVIDSIMTMAAKYGIPYFANFVNSDMSPDDVRSMCCRLRLDNRELRKRGGGLFGANPLTGSIGVVTINLARLGYVSNTKKEFFAKLKNLMTMAKTSLEIKRKIIEKNTRIGLYPYSKYYLQDVYDATGNSWSNHFNTIGINGMNESIMNFFDTNENITTPQGLKFANEVMDFMREILADYQEEANVLYNLEATPAEGTTYRLAMLDKAKYPDIITAGEEAPYYTNSTQLPVNATDDLFQALDLQEELQTKYTGGTVFHGYLGESIDKEIAKNLVKKVMETYELPYFTLSPTFSVCPKHGYLKGEQKKCPICKTQTEVWARVVGFHRPLKDWNNGKVEEYKERTEFKA